MPYQHKAQAYSALTFLKDHANLTADIFRLYGAYLGPYSIDPALNEAIMVTVNSVNECPYCTMLHTEGAAKLVGGFDGVKLQGASTAAEARAWSFDDPAITFAYTFGETGGYGPDKDAALAVLIEAKGPAQAKSIHALCRYMMWGGRTGNTIQGFLWGTLCCHPRPGSFLALPLQALFELVLVCYYAFLFLLAIPLVGKIFKHVFPAKIPHLASGIIGCTLVTVAGLFIVPMGILGAVTYPLQMLCNRDPPKKTPKGCKAVKKAVNPTEESKSPAPADTTPLGTAIP